MTDYDIQNGDRRMTFTGEQLAFASTGEKRRDGSYPLRWLEVTIYRTSTGAYVLHTNGKSRVWRPAGEQPYSKTIPDLTVPMTKITREFINKWFTDHEYPPAGDPKYGFPIIDDYIGELGIFETDRPRAVYSTTAEGLIEAARIEDREGVLFITRTAEQALREAASKDEAIKTAFFTERVQ